jgi:hypothetical protein
MGRPWMALNMVLFEKRRSDPIGLRAGQTGTRGLPVLLTIIMRKLETEAGQTSAIVQSRNAWYSETIALSISL